MESGQTVGGNGAFDSSFSAPQNSQEFIRQPVPVGIYNDGGGDVVLVQSKKSSKRKIIFVAATLFVIVISAIIVVSVIRANEFSFRQNVLDLTKSLEWASYTGQCPRLMVELENDSYKQDEYIELANLCRDEAAQIKALIDSLAGRGPKEFKDFFADLRDEVYKSVVFGEELEEELNICSAWHEWFLGSGDINNYATLSDEKIDEIARPLQESNSQVLSEYGNKWAELSKDLVEINLKKKIFPDNVEIQELLRTKAAMADLMREKPDIADIISIGSLEYNTDLSRLVYQLKAYDSKENL